LKIELRNNKINFVGDMEILGFEDEVCELNGFMAEWFVDSLTI